MFDRFESSQRIEKQNFEFKPSRYETWIDGKIVSSGITESIISAKIIMQDGSEKVEITFLDANLNTELAQKNIFDEFVTGTDRLELIIIPEETEVEIMAMTLFKMMIGATRQRKDFNSNEPFCVNLFLQKGVIAKVTFTFSNPEKLIEFYQDENIEKVETVREYKWLKEENFNYIIENVYSYWLYEEEKVVEKDSHLPYGFGETKKTGKYCWGFHTRANAQILEVGSENIIINLWFECVNKVYWNDKNIRVPKALIFHVQPTELNAVQQWPRWLPQELKIAINSPFIVSLCRDAILEHPSLYSNKIFKKTYNLEDFNM